MSCKFNKTKPKKSKVRDKKDKSYHLFVEVINIGKNNFLQDLNESKNASEKILIKKMMLDDAFKRNRAILSKRKEFIENFKKKKFEVWEC